MNYTKISRELLKGLSFRVMDESDREGFAGAMSPVSLIAENESEGIMVVIDGGRVELYADDGSYNFEVIDTCDDICELPF